MNVLVDLTDTDAHALQEACTRESISIAEGLRRAVAMYVRESAQDHRPAKAGQAESGRDRLNEPAADAAFGSWRDGSIDGADYTRRLRGEWDDRDQSIDEFRRVQRSAALRATFGMWKDRGVDTDTYLAEIRAEWDRDWDPD